MTRFRGSAPSHMFATTPQDGEGYRAQSCPSDANHATANHITTASSAGDAASSTTSLLQHAVSSFAEDYATQHSTTQGTTTEEYELHSHFSDDTSCATRHDQLLQDDSDEISNSTSTQETSPKTWPAEAESHKTGFTKERLTIDKHAEINCATSQHQDDDEQCAHEVKRRTTDDSASRELLSQGLSWPGLVAASDGTFPDVALTHFNLPPPLRNSADIKLHATVLPRGLPCALAADYFDRVQVPTPTKVAVSDV